MSDEAKPRQASPQLHADEVEGETTKTPPDEPEPAAAQQPLLRLALIEHASAPIAWVVMAVVGLLLLKQPLAALQDKVSEIQVSSFRVQLQTNAEGSGLAQLEAGARARRWQRCT